MSDAPGQTPTEAVLRAALHEEWEIVMTTTDTESELRRFQAAVHRRTAGPGVLWAAAGVLLLLAAGAFLVLRGAGGMTGSDVASVGDATGRLEVVYDSTGSRTVEPARTEAIEERDASLLGDITVQVGDTTRSGSARLSLNDSFVPTGGGPVVFHAWGDVQADLNGVSCRGSYGFSWYHDGPETGGALQVRCDDGTVLGAALSASRVQSLNERVTWQLDLVDGFASTE